MKEFHVGFRQTRSYGTVMARRTPASVRLLGETLSILVQQWEFRVKSQYLTVLYWGLVSLI